MKTTKREILDLYFDFLTEEIPAFIQIITFYSFLNFFVFKESLLWQLFVCVLLNSIFSLYLFRKMQMFLFSEIVNQFSTINRKKLGDKEVLLSWKRYIFITVTITAIFFGILPNINQIMLWVINKIKIFR